MTLRPLINWRNKVNKSGIYPVHLRVTIDSMSEYYPVKLPIKGIPLADWSGREGTWVKNTNPYNFQINNEITKTIKVVTDLNKRLFDQGMKLTFYHLDKEFNFKGNRLLFNDYFKNYMRDPPATVTITNVTWEKYDGFIKMLDKFNPRIRFEEIDVDMVARIRNYMAQQKGRKAKFLAPATVKSYFDKFKVVLEHAAKRDNMMDIKLVESFFEDVKVSVPSKEEGLHLEINEVRAIRQLHFDKRYPSHERDRDLFLFQVYTGYYYNDLKIFERKHLRKDHEYGYYMIGERDKNGNPTIIPLWKFPYAADIIKKYQDPDPESKYVFRRDVFIDAQVYNRNVKVIAKMAGVRREVSNKTARHTNIQMWIRMGAERPVVSKMVGHGKESTTENYYKVNILEVIEGTKDANFESLAI